MTTIPSPSCPDSPTEAHWWLVSPLPEQHHQCRYCGTEYTLGRLPAEGEVIARPTVKQKAAAKGGHHPSPTTVALRAAIGSLAVGESCEAEHEGLACTVTIKGVKHGCRLLKLVARMRQTTLHGFAVSHQGAHQATVRRTG